MESAAGSERVVDYRIAPAVLESIVRHSLAGDRRVQIPHGVSRGSRHAVDVVVEDGVCVVTLRVHALLGEDLAALAGWIRQIVGTRLTAMTGMRVGRVDVHFEGVYPPSASGLRGSDSTG
ncbi:MAG: hypothetical protein ACYC33_01995 [Thermoleophilia bacterium]